jgi:RNase P subunit RPR2
MPLGADEETMTYDHCSNCQQPIQMEQAAQALILRQGEKTIAIICPDCQQAKKIQLTLARQPDRGWSYYQLFPVET